MEINSLKLGQQIADALFQDELIKASDIDTVAGIIHRNLVGQDSNGNDLAYWLKRKEESQKFADEHPGNPTNDAELEMCDDWIKKLTPDESKDVAPLTTAEKDRHAICEIGRLLLGDNKDCYSADAVLREAKNILAKKPDPWDEFPPGGLHASSDIRKVMNDPKEDLLRRYHMDPVFHKFVQDMIHERLSHHE
jgi:hypothetical protein